MVLTEDGLYEVLMLSRKPIAKQFKKEVKKILKALRKGEVALVPQLPTNYIEALEALLTSEKEKQLLKEENETLKNENETLTPMANWFEDFMNSDGLYTSTQVAKLYGISSARKLNQLLNEDLHLIYKQGKNWLTYSTTDVNWFKVVVGETNGHNFSSLKITPKGVIEISKLLEISIKEEDLENLLEEE